MKIRVAWTPPALEAIDLSGRVAAAVDVVRATTTILAALEAGARCVLPVASREEARAVARRREADGHGEPPRLCGERGGRRIEGFDHGNSPRELAEADVEDRILVFTTTNGTPLLRRLEGARETVLACFRNLSAVAHRLAAHERDVVIACAGKEGRPGADDLACAGYLVRALRRRSSRAPELDDGARDALALASLPNGPDGEWLASTAAGRALLDVGLGEDLAWCAEVDASLGVPVLRDGEVRLAGADREGTGD